MSRPVNLESLRAALVRVNPRVREYEVTPGTSIVDDLGFDSLHLLDLVLALEATWGIDEFPIQVWYDRESVATGARFTAETLIALGLSLVQRD